MTLSILDRYITQTDSGITVPSAVVTIYTELGVEADLFEDKDGVIPAGNPVTADANGRIKVYMKSGKYSASAAFGGDVVNYPDILVGGKADETELSRGEGSTTVQDYLSLPYSVNVKTLSEAIASDLAVEGDFIKLSDRDFRMFQYQSSGIANDDNIIACTGTALYLVDVDIDAFDVFIVYGQSNSIGYAGQPGVPAVDDAATPTGDRYAKNYDPATNTIIPISNTMNHLNYILESGGSRGNAWTAFANRWINETGRGCVILSAGRGGATISQLQKGNINPVAPDSVGDADYYQRMVDGYASAAAAMTAQGYPIGNTYMLFHQGETDQRDGTLYTDYRDDMQALLTDVFADIPALSKFGLYIVGCPDSRPQESWQRIQSAQYAATRYGSASGTTDNTAVIYEDCPTFRQNNGQYNPADGTHYSQRGYNQMGDASAINFAEWVASSTDYNGTKDDARQKLSVQGVGYIPMQKVAAIASLSGGNWTLLRKSNTSATESFYPSYVEGVSDATGVLRFKMSGKAPVVFDMNVEVNKSGINSSIYPIIKKYTLSNEWGFEIEFYADLTFAVDTSSGGLFEGYPLSTLTAGSIIDQTISVDSFASNVATISHPTTSVPITATYYGTSAGEAGQAGSRAVTGIQTKIGTSGTNSVAIVQIKRVKLTLTQLEGIGDIAVRISATVGDDL